MLHNKLQICTIASFTGFTVKQVLLKQARPFNCHVFSFTLRQTRCERVTFVGGGGATLSGKKHQSLAELQPKQTQ